MMRYCLLIVLIPLFSQAQRYTALDIKQLKLYSTGIFSNNVQAKTDTQFVRSALHLQPIWQKRKDGAWLFVERTDTGTHYQVWHFYQQDDTTLVLQFLDFKEPQKALELSRNIKQQSNLFIYNLFHRHGCEVYLKKNKTGYVGTSLGKECFVNAAGSEYVSLTVGFTKNGISWQQVNFDKDDRELPGILKGSYKFLKTPNSSK